jgi:hypothetical protein
VVGSRLLIVLTLALTLPQGGDLSATVRAAVRPDGLGLLLPVSRGISRAADPAAEALRLRDAINVERAAAAAAAAAAKDARATAVAAEHGWSPAKRSLADGLLEVNSLASDLISPTPPWREIGGERMRRVYQKTNNVAEECGVGRTIVCCRLGA